MKELKIGKKTYKLQFGYAVVAKGDVLKHAMTLQEMFSGSEKDETGSDFFVKMGDMMDCLGELLLAALQKNHSDEFGYQVRTGNKHDEALEKVCDLLDKYFDSDDADAIGLYSMLFEELENNGFLRHLLRELEQTQETESKSE